VGVPGFSMSAILRRNPTAQGTGCRRTWAAMTLGRFCSMTSPCMMPAAMGAVHIGTEVLLAIQQLLRAAHEACLPLRVCVLTGTVVPVALTASQAHLSTAAASWQPHRIRRGWRTRGAS